MRLLFASDQEKVQIFLDKFIKSFCNMKLYCSHTTVGIGLEKRSISLTPWPSCNTWSALHLNKYTLEDFVTHTIISKHLERSDETSPSSPRKWDRRT